MKPLLLCFALLAALPLVNAAPTDRPQQAAAPEQTEIVFVAPEDFTDVRDSYTGSDSGREDVLQQLRQYIGQQAKRVLGPGDRLFLSITDVDLAGEYEPWVGPNWDNVRIVKDIYPPRMDLSFRLVDANGQVVMEGRRELRDMAFLMKTATGFRDDALRHEKALVNDWLRTEFRGRRKK